MGFLETRITIGSRADLAPGTSGEAPLGDWEGPSFSAVTGDGLRDLVGEMATLVAQARAEQPRPVSFAVHRPEPGGIIVERDVSGDWVVLGRSATRAVALSTLTDIDALAFAQNRLRSLGVDRALARAGAREGDRVHIGTFEFDYAQD